MGEVLRRAMHPTGSRSLPLWFGTLGPPLLWGAQLLAADALFELGCGPGFDSPRIYGIGLRFWALVMVSALLALDVAAGLLAYRAYRQIRAGRGERHATIQGRARAMAVAGMASSFVYGLLLVYGLFPTFFLRSCAPST